ncbi:ABC-type amino acid transport substrate-binding protein [Oxalobacteraceae bacterium GrIS 1.11]
MAITLCSRHLVLDKVGDLAKRRMAAFQNAHLFLGDEFAAVTANNADYREVSPQVAIDRLLYAHRIEVGISDINIFKNMDRQLGADIHGAQPLCTYALFPPTPYRLAFRSRTVRDRFNVALKQLLQSDYYATLARRYGLPLLREHPYFKPASAAPSQAQSIAGEAPPVALRRRPRASPIDMAESK